MPYVPNIRVKTAKDLIADLEDANDAVMNEYVNDDNDRFDLADAIKEHFVKAACKKSHAKSDAAPYQQQAPAQSVNAQFKLGLSDWLGHANIMCCKSVANAV